LCEPLSQNEKLATFFILLRDHPPVGNIIARGRGAGELSTGQVRYIKQRFILYDRALHLQRGWISFLVIFTT